jgi:hypothetical protein
MLFVLKAKDPEPNSGRENAIVEDGVAAPTSGQFTEIKAPILPGGTS